MDTAEIYTQAIDLLHRNHGHKLTLNSNLTEHQRLLELKQLELPPKKTVDDDKTLTNADKRKVHFTKLFAQDTGYQALKDQINDLEQHKQFLHIR